MRIPSKLVFTFDMVCVPSFPGKQQKHLSGFSESQPTEHSSGPFVSRGSRTGCSGILVKLAFISRPFAPNSTTGADSYVLSDFK